MKTCNAIVVGLKENGIAEVVFKSSSPGIPGASDEINSKACHCDQRPIVIDARNDVKAEKGDLVQIKWNEDMVRKKLWRFTAPIAMGIGAGIILALILDMLFYPGYVFWITLPLLGLVVGTLFSFLHLSRSGDENLPVVSRIINKGDELQFVPLSIGCQKRGYDPSCDSCSGRLF